MQAAVTAKCHIEDSFLSGHARKVGAARLSLRRAFSRIHSSSYRMQNAEAGPSTVIDPSLLVDTSAQTSRADEAPLRPLPSAHFYSVEYPGYVQPTSVPRALKTLGGQGIVESAFKRTANRNNSILELNLRPGNPFAHPIPGEIIPTNNLVLKVVKRRRKRKDGEATADGPAIGEYTVQAVGVIPKTARFRSMYHYASLFVCSSSRRHGRLPVSA